MCKKILWNKHFLIYRPIFCGNDKFIFFWQHNIDTLFFSGDDNVMGVSACIRNKDHVVIVMPYFKHDKFTVSFTMKVYFIIICNSIIKLF